MHRHRGTRFWVGVASRDHVRVGMAGGFAQLGHGKKAPLARMASGDWLVYYSPRTRRDAGEPYQRFTAIGQIGPGEIYQHRMREGFVPYRRDVQFLPAREAPIGPLLPRLGFTKDGRRWGYVFRRGHFEIDESDFRLIAAAMGVETKRGSPKTPAPPDSLSLTG